MTLVGVPLIVVGRIVVPLILPVVTVVVWRGLGVGTSMSTILVGVPLTIV